MLHHYIIGVGAFVLLSAAWLGVQRAWRKSFADVGEDPDALAGRSGCYGCSRVDVCREPETEACEAEEECDE